MSLLDKLSKDEAQELPMIDIMYHYMQEQRQPVDFYTLMNKIAEYKEWREEKKKEKLVQAYTDMNIDGRFVSLGDNKWGLKSWYPVEQTVEELAKTIKPKKREQDFDETVAELDEDEIVEHDGENEWYAEDEAVALGDEEAYEDEEWREDDTAGNEYNFDDE